MKKQKEKKEKSEDEVTLREEAGTDAMDETSIEAAGTEPAAPDFEKQYGELLDRYQRSLAEFDNFRKRTIKEKAAQYDEGLRAAAEKLLPVIDNFERALKAVENKDDTFYQGITMIARQFDGAISDMGIETIAAAAGETFNHNLHFAVAHVEDEEYGSNVIVEELQKGYRHKDRIIRPSMVKVAN